MKIAGIIAEYNPFHYGHQYQIEELRRRTGADRIIVAMSGDFVQRGEPAVYDKYTRTCMALNGGADLVLELPSAFAASSAEDFAACGVALLDRIGVVDLLCFGSECGETGRLMGIARLLAEEPEDFQALLGKRLSAGDSFPRARARAILDWRSASGQPTDGYDYERLLASPNNILGIEYCKALIRQNSSIRPFTIRRKGQDYLDSEFHPDDAFASASAIRRALQEGRQEEAWACMPCPPAGPSGQTFLRPAGLVPRADSSLPADISLPPAIFLEDLSALLNYRLLELDRNGQDLTEFSDVSPELAGRVRNQLLQFSSFPERIRQLKTRQYTWSRVSRALLHILLGTTRQQIGRYRAIGYAPYARILGFRKSAVPLLTEIKKQGRIPMITKNADAGQILTDADALHCFQYDLYCSHVYQTLVQQKFPSAAPGKNEYTRSPVMIP